jgi:peroxiredoxin
LTACGAAAPAGDSAMKDDMPAQAPAATPVAPAATAGDKPTTAAETATETPAAEAGAAEEMPADAAAGPAWMAAELVNVKTGQSFKIADFQGKVVLVETLAVWCSNCLRQQNEVKALHGALPSRDDLVSVGLGIDLQESGEALKVFTDKHGFDWHYAIATPDVAREIGNLYGAQFLNPPSTPMLVIDKQGQAHPLPFGIKSAEALEQALEPFLSQ